MSSSTDTPDDSHKAMLDRLCAAYPQMEREVLDIALYAHEAWEREIGANYDAHTAGNGEGVTPAEAPDASSDPVPA